MDALDRDPGDVFALPDLWGGPQFFKDKEELSSLLFEDLDLSNDTFTLLRPDNHIQPKYGFFALPDLGLELPELETPSISTESLSDDALLQPPNDHEFLLDLWELQNDPTPQIPKLLTWDIFEDSTFEEPQNPYLSEAGPEVFDAAVACSSDFLGTEATRQDALIDSGLYARSLVELGLGRSSLVFSWDDEQQSFRQSIDDVRISGYTSETTTDLSASFLQCGNITRSLQDFVDKTYAKTQSATRIAMADAISTLIHNIQIRIDGEPRQISSVLRLQAQFRPVLSLLVCFQNLVNAVMNTNSDESLLSSIYHEILSHEEGPEDFRLILREVLTRVSAPWLDFASEWLGTKREEGTPITKFSTGKSFVRVGIDPTDDELDPSADEPDFFLDDTAMPSFIAPEDAQLLFETGKTLRFLRSESVVHPIAHADLVAAASPPALGWAFTWDNIENVQSKALGYEQNLRTAIKQYSDDGRNNIRIKQKGPEIDVMSSLDIFGKTQEDIDSQMLNSIHALSKPLTLHTTTPISSSSSSSSPLSVFLSTALLPSPHVSPQSGSLPPPLPLCATLSLAPLIRAQARLLNASSLRHLLGGATHDLRSHLRLLRAFHLLGNGLFASHLCRALLDPDRAPAEERRGVPRSDVGGMGLRLGHGVARRGEPRRDDDADADAEQERVPEWPPAGSELRLALAGVLGDSYAAMQGSGSVPGSGRAPRVRVSSSNSSRNSSELPSGLSFAVRELPEEEIARLLAGGADGVHALDFLRLAYQPATTTDGRGGALAAVISARCLRMYDAAFVMLLRVLRVRFVSERLVVVGTGGGGGGRGRRRRQWQRPADVGAEGEEVVGGEEEEDEEEKETADDRRLAIEARQFVGAVTGYFFDDAIEASWRVLERKVEEVERRLEDEEETTQLGCDEGVEGLRDFHEMVLERMLFGLFLRKRQRAVAEALEAVFEVILSFAAARRRTSLRIRRKRGRREEGDVQINKSYAVKRNWYEEWKRKVGTFIALCRSMGEGRGYGEKKRGRGEVKDDAGDVGLRKRRRVRKGLFEGRELVEENTVERLLVRLDMSGFYARRV